MPHSSGVRYDPQAMHYDAIVVGAGPAGSTLARHLARSGARVLLLDRAAFPRDKPCGGGVTLRAASRLDLDLSPVTEQTIFDVRVTYRLGRAFRHHYPAAAGLHDPALPPGRPPGRAGRSRRRRVPRRRARASRGGERPSGRRADREGRLHRPRAGRRRRRQRHCGTQHGHGPASRPGGGPGGERASLPRRAGSAGRRRWP